MDYFGLLKVVSLILFIIRPIKCYNQSYLEHFNKDTLSEHFRTFNLPSCSPQVSQCWSEVHDWAEHCIRQFRSKSGSKVAQCTARGDLQASEKEFEEISFQWHHSMNKCFFNNEFNFTNGEEDIEEFKNRTTRVVRRKRTQNLVDDNAAENVEESEENEVNETNFRKSAKRCWSRLHRLKAACFEISFQCPIFASCFGVGKEPDESTALKWYKLVKRQRKLSQKKIADHKQKMLNCIESP